MGSCGKGHALVAKILDEKILGVCFTIRWIKPTLANYTLKIVKPVNFTVCDIKKKKTVIKGVLKLYDFVLLFH